MRPSLNALSAIFLITLMVCSVAIPQITNMESENENLEEEPAFFEALGRSSPPTMLAAGSGANNEDGEHIAALPNGGWVIGSEFNSTLTYGQQTLQPTSPYPGFGVSAGEFFLGILDDKGTWMNLVGADHNQGSGAISYLTDIAVGMAGEIFISGYFYGEIAFGPPGPSSIITNLNSGYHYEGFIAKADPMGNWMWASSFSTLVNGTGEFSETSALAVDMMGDLFVTGGFSGETNFGGISINATSNDVFVAKFDGNAGTLSWVINGGGIGSDQVFDMSITPSGGVKLATITDGVSQWGTNTYIANGNLDAVIVEIDGNGGWHHWNWYKRSDYCCFEIACRCRW